MFYSAVIDFAFVRPHANERDVIGVIFLASLALHLPASARVRLGAELLPAFACE